MRTTYRYAHLTETTYRLSRHEIAEMVWQSQGIARPNDYEVSYDEDEDELVITVQHRKDSPSDSASGGQ